MKTPNSLIVTLAIIVACGGTGATQEVDFTAHPWRTPGPTDSRGPCPGLNTLANHGFLPRDGKNISIPMILEAGRLAYNMQQDILLGAAKVGLLTSEDILTLSLEGLKEHGVIEHDASLSRGDFALGDNFHFNETIFSTLADSNPGSDVYNTTSAGQVLHARLEDSNKNNPNVTNSETQLIIRSGESGFYLSVMGDPVQGVAPKKFVQIFFREERLPIEEGWKRPSVPITRDSIGTLVQTIATASNWTPSGNTCSGIELFRSE
ncbi:Cloroperoxidase [Marasmius fiardii PR-910]|nr:Cloroperoxidase [Marasmius fiardii PR-910]